MKEFLKKLFGLKPVLSSENEKKIGFEKNRPAIISVNPEYVKLYISLKHPNAAIPKAMVISADEIAKQVENMITKTLEPGLEPGFENDFRKPFMNDSILSLEVDKLIDLVVEEYS